MSAGLKAHREKLRDSAYSIGGLVLMQAAAQLLLYPLLARIMGEVRYGELQYLMAFVNIATVSIGTAANLSRITAPREEREGAGGAYNRFLLGVALLGVPLCLLIWRFGGVEMDHLTAFTYYLVFVAMAFRYYADVIYKITLSYRRYFLYYLTIGMGYVLGALLFRRTGLWPLAILTGEAAGVGFAYLTEGGLRGSEKTAVPLGKSTLRALFILCLSEGAANLILNADRLLLKLLVGSAAVTVYYLSTLVGKTVSLFSTPFSGVLLGYLARYEGGLRRRSLRWIAPVSLAAILLGTGAATLGGYVMLRWLYPAELDAVRPYLLYGSLAEVLYFTTTVLTALLARFGKKRYQIYVNGLFALCFVGLGIPATLLYDVRGFAVAAVIAGVLRWLAALLLLFFTAKE